MIALLSLAAFAQQEDAAMIACEPMYVAGVLPEVDAAGVPTDALVTVFLLGDCGAPTYYDIRVEDADGNVVADERFESPQVGDRLAVDPGELSANSRYEVTITPGDGWGEVTETWFTTGSGPAEALQGVPTVQLFDVIWSPRDDVVSGWTLASPATDPAGPSWLEIRDDDGAAFSGMLTTGVEAEVEGWFSRPAAQRPEEVCVTAVQIRVNGEEVASAPACAEPERQAGPLSCSTTASPAGLWPLALLFFARRRR